MPVVINILLVLIAVSPACVLGHPGANTTIEHFTHLVEHQPTEQAPYIQRGIAYSAAAQYEQALQDFEKARTLGPPLAVSFDLGVLHYRRGEYDLANAYFSEYLAKFPGHGASYEYRARLRRDMGDTEGAMADYQQFFKQVERPNPGHYIAAANMLDSENEQDTVQALAILDSGTTKLGLTPQLQNRAVELELKRGRIDLAIARFATLKPMLGHSPDWKIDMADLLLRAGDKKAALALADEAMEQLDTLRVTPARQALKVRIAKIRG